MPRNWKFHAIVISGITLGTIAMFYLMGGFSDPESAQPAAQQYVGPVITINSASWGLNCIKATEEAIERLESRSQSASNEDYEEIIKEMESLKPIPQRDNALEKLQNLCNQKPECVLAFAPESLDFQINKFCNYELEVDYLCNTFDAIKQAKLAFGETATLQCSDKPADVSIEAPAQQ